MKLKTLLEYNTKKNKSNYDISTVTVKELENLLLQAETDEIRSDLKNAIFHRKVCDTMVDIQDKIVELRKKRKNNETK